MTSENYVLYGAPNSFFTGKALVYMKYKGIPFTFKMSSVKVFKKIIVPRTGMAFIPVVITPEDEVLQDTTHIIDTLEERFPQRPIYPKTAMQHLVCLLLEVFGDDWLVMPAMHYRWNYLDENHRELLNHFGDASMPGWPRMVKNFVGRKVWKRFSGHVPKMGITQRTIPALERAFEDLMAHLNAHFSNHPYLLGGRPTLADFGLIGGFSAHLGLDPYPRKLMSEKAPQLVDWIQRMREPEEDLDELLADDQIPDTLLPVLRQMFTLQVPFLHAGAVRLRDWTRENPDKHIPRSLGRLPYSIGEVTEEKVTLPYNQWMWQRPLVFYQSLAEEEKSKVDALLASVDGKDLINSWPDIWLDKQNNQLILKTA